MSKIRFTPWIVLACISSLAACTSGEGGTASNTELNVIVPTNAGTPNEIDIETVEYTINCLGNDDTFLDNMASFPDEVTLNGNLEVVDGRTNSEFNGSPAGTPGFGQIRPGDRSEIWQGFEDLPPGPCTIELRARDNDGEVICTAREPFAIYADAISKVNLILICDISFQAPVGSLDVDGTFSFNVGNFCPDLFVFNAIDETPEEVDVGIGVLFAGTFLEVRFRDGDSTCGDGCDPQSCEADPDDLLAGLVCTPGPDPGVSTTITCTSNPVAGQNETALLDCDGDFVPEASCVLNGDTLGILSAPPIPGDSNPGLNASAGIACNPPLLGGTVGATITCTAVTTDGDLDCNKTEVVTINCPGLTPCEQYFVDGGPGGTAGSCDDGNICTANACDDLLATGGVCDAGCCVNDPLPPGTPCTAPNGECGGTGQPTPTTPGVCEQQGCLADDANCDDGNPCTVDVCEAADDLCSNDADATQDTVACDAGGGAGSGSCDSTSTDCSPPGGANSCVTDEQRFCAANDTCDVDADCVTNNDPPLTGSQDPECALQVCNSSGIPNVCELDTTTNIGVSCDGGAGACASDGTCGTLPVDLDPVTLDISMACTNQAQPQMSEIPGTLTVDPRPGLLAGGSFETDMTGNLNFPENFLDVATTLLPPGTTTAQIVALAATVEVRSGAAGSNVAIPVDPSLPTICAISATTCDPSLNANNGTNPVCLPSALDTCGSIVNLPLSTVDTVCANLTGALGTRCVGGANDGDVCDPGDDGGASACPGATGFVVQPCENGTKLIELANFEGCILGDLALPLGNAVGAYTAGPSGTMLFGWIDDAAPTSATLKQCPDTGNSECYSTNPGCDLGELTSPVCAVDGPYTDGSFNYWSLPTPSFSGTLGPLAMKVNAGLQVAINCIMGAVITPPKCEFVSPFCNGGADDGLSCDPDIECPGGSCTSGSCVGGDNDLAACDADADCTAPGNCQTVPPCGCNSADANATNPDGCATMLGETPDGDLISFTIP